jgi:hypothetical protein
MAMTLTVIWWLYGYRLWKNARREGHFALVQRAPSSRSRCSGVA